MRILTLISLLALTHAWVPLSPTAITRRAATTTTARWALLDNKDKSSPAVDKEEQQQSAPLDETTEKYGLEAGLFQSMKQQDGESAKSLLKKYGIAYLATSIPLALVSFAICYVLVDNGVDMGALLAKVGIEGSNSAETAGTFGLAYAAHKAASPIRFPPTVLLTPVVAKWIGKEPSDEEEEAAP